MKKLCVIFISLFCLQFAMAGVETGALHYRHVVWNGMPIDAVIPTGQERIITFPGKWIEFNANQLTTQEVSIIKNGQTVYITAKKTFAKQRVMVKLDNGETVLMDISAKPNAEDTPLRVELPAPTAAFKAQQSEADKKMVSMITLTRYAIQHTYAPERLVKDSLSISRAPMYTEKTVNLFYGDQVLAMPLVSWSSNDLYVTLVLLKNTWPNAITLDPRQVHGSWEAASFYPSNKLAPKGEVHDVTSLFLISKIPFGQALQANKEYRL